ncbi:MAG: nucleotidyltransferase family protein, partial [Solirubrobacteraceae bacterium]
SAGGDALRLARVVRRAPILMEALRAAREVGAPDWLIAAGSVRDVVWDDLHGRPLDAFPHDVDLAFFDPSDLAGERDREVEDAARRRAPALPWQAKNQAAVHLWYPKRFGFDVPPFPSSATAIATFPEVATCVALRLLDDEDLLVVAPYGLEDLFGCVCRHNPTRISATFYAERVATKEWRRRWPQMQYVVPEEEGT